MTRTQFLLALLLAAVLGFGVAVVVRGGRLQAAGERFRDTAAALKKMYRERPSPGAPRQQLVATPPAG